MVRSHETSFIGCGSCSGQLIKMIESLSFMCYRRCEDRYQTCSWDLPILNPFTTGANWNDCVFVCQLLVLASRLNSSYGSYGNIPLHLPILGTATFTYQVCLIFFWSSTCCQVVPRLAAVNSEVRVRLSTTKAAGVCGCSDSLTFLRPLSPDLFIALCPLVFCLSWKEDEQIHCRYS